MQSRNISSTVNQDLLNNIKVLSRAINVNKTILSMISIGMKSTALNVEQYSDKV